MLTALRSKQARQIHRLALWVMRISPVASSLSAWQLVQNRTFTGISKLMSSS
jgi:hypothetical protein